MFYTLKMALIGYVHLYLYLNSVFQVLNVKQSFRFGLRTEHNITANYGEQGA